MFQATQIGYQLKLVFSQTSATFSLTATEIDFGTMEARDVELKILQAKGVKARRY
jgi:hypothetical protein